MSQRVFWLSWIEHQGEQVAALAMTEDGYLTVRTIDGKTDTAELGSTPPDNLANILHRELLARDW